MLLDNLKNLIKDFEVVLSKDIRFKEDMYFKNQIKIIYSHGEKTKNVFVPLMLANLNKTTEIDEVTKLKDRITYLEKVESLPEEVSVCPPCNCSQYEQGKLPNSTTVRKNYNDVTRRIETTSSEEDELNTIYKANNSALKSKSISEQINSLKQLIPNRVENLSNNEIIQKIIKYQK